MEAQRHTLNAPRRAEKRSLCNGQAPHFRGEESSGPTPALVQPNPFLLPEENLHHPGRLPRRLPSQLRARLLCRRDLLHHGGHGVRTRTHGAWPGSIWTAGTKVAGEPLWVPASRGAVLVAVRS